MKTIIQIAFVVSFAILTLFSLRWRFSQRFLIFLWR